MESPFLSFDGEVRSGTVDVDEGDEEHSNWYLRPPDHVGGKLRKAVGFGMTTLAPATRSGRGVDGLVDRINCLANDVFYCSHQ